MMHLLVGYFLASGLIAVLVMMAGRNRQDGWRRERVEWLEDQADAAIRAFEAKGAPAEAGHLAELGRLNDALVEQGVPQAPEAAEKPVKSGVLA